MALFWLFLVPADVRHHRGHQSGSHLRAWVPKRTVYTLFLLTET